MIVAAIGMVIIEDPAQLIVSELPQKQPVGHCEMTSNH